MHRRLYGTYLLHLPSLLGYFGGLYVLIVIPCFAADGAVDARSSVFGRVNTVMLGQLLSGLPGTEEAAKPCNQTNEFVASSLTYFCIASRHFATERSSRSRWPARHNTVRSRSAARSSKSSFSAKAATRRMSFGRRLARPLACTARSLST